jgi:ketosteroid isomerase-like protein
MTMKQPSLDERGERIRAAWNSQEVDRVLETYADDFRYVDPDTRGAIEDRDGLRRYLTKLFAAIRAHTDVREVHQLAGSEGVLVLWSATVRRADGPEEVELNGVDVIHFSGERIASHEIYFDRAALAPLFTAATA